MRGNAEEAVRLNVREIEALQVLLFFFGSESERPASAKSEIQAADLQPSDPRVTSANDRLERLQQEHGHLGGSSGSHVEQPRQQNVGEDTFFDETTGLVC